MLIGSCPNICVSLQTHTPLVGVYMLIIGDAVKSVNTNRWQSRKTHLLARLALGEVMRQEWQGYGNSYNYGFRSSVWGHFP